MKENEKIFHCIYEIFKERILINKFHSFLINFINSLSVYRKKLDKMKYN